MNLNLGDVLILVISASTVVGLIYKVARLEARIFGEIKDVNYKLELFKEKYEGTREMIEFRLHGLQEMIQHKFDRLYRDQKDIQAFLDKTTQYKPRE